MKKITFKQFALFVCLLCAAMITVTATLAQPFVSMEAGNGIGINAGYAKGVVIQAGLNVPYTRRADKPHIFYGSLGYEFGNDFTIIPSIGISRYGMEINKTALLTSIEAGKNFTTQAEHYGRYYLYARHSVRMFYGAGLRIFIK